MRPPDLGAVLSIWAAGLAAGAAVVAFWDVARAGYIRLAGGIVALLGVLAILADAPLWDLLAAVLAVVAAIWRQRLVAAPALAVAAVAFLLAGSGLGWLSAAVGAASLGGITSEMLLGHWFLVDPKLPRWPLRRLAIAGIFGALLEGAVVAGNDEDLLVSKWLLAGLAGFAAFLMVGVTFSLRVKSYTGVMAATGLSYLATLLALAVAIIARPT
ncbi:MAG: hypothetical protein ABR609_06660 [Acidimicrobiia bacterium]